MVWVMCSIMAIAADGVTRNYMLPAVKKLEAVSEYIYVDFAPSLEYNKLKLAQGESPQRLIHINECDPLKTMTRYNNVRKTKKFPETTD